MANTNNDRKKQISKIIVTIAILLIATVVTANQVGESEPSNTGTQPNGQTSSSEVQNPQGELRLTMIDCGQADSFLLAQHGETCLVDCGTRSTGKDVVQYLKDQGITKIDYLFGTHPHDDHMGGMYDVITNFEIGKVIIPKVKDGTVTTNWYLKLMKELKQNSYNIEYVSLGTIYQLGQATINVIGPSNEPDDNKNNYSTVLKVSFGEMDIIMTGDAEKKVEQDIIESGINLDAEILKVGHHGSDTSTSEAFLDAISPDYALISTEVGNKYDHPIKVTMDNLKSRNIEVYRTDENGTVVAHITTKDVSFDCQPGDYLSGTELAERSAKND